MIPVLRPTIDEQTKQELLAVLDSGWWGQGPKTLELEAKFASYVGARFAVATNSCTSALDLCLKSHGIRGGELITTPMTFVADAIVGEWNDMQVTFADIRPDTLCLDAEVIKPTSQTKAIIAVDSHGRLAPIRAIRNQFDGLVIEDAAHAMYTPGAGQDADVTVWSFQAVKTMPAGDGGMITTNDELLYGRLRALTWLGIEKTTYGRTGKRYTWDYDITQGQGTKSYMNDLTAVICLGQLRRLEETNARRREIQAAYNTALSTIKQIHTPAYSHTVQYYTMECQDRDPLSESLADRGIATSVHFKPLSAMTYWKKAATRPLPVTENVWPRLLSLPVHNALSNEHLSHICSSIAYYYEQH